MFIRTKDGRIISYDENANKIDLPMILNYPNQILKQADTIEELCDEIIKKEPNHKHPEWLIGDVMNYLRNERFMKIMTTRIKNGTLKIFVGIWVDDNFIKVAELNEKGELELI